MGEECGRTGGGPRRIRARGKYDRAQEQGGEEQQAESNSREAVGTDHKKRFQFVLEMPTAMGSTEGLLEPLSVAVLQS